MAAILYQMKSVALQRQVLRVLLDRVCRILKK